MIRRLPRSTLFPTRRSSDLEELASADRVIDVGRGDVAGDGEAQGVDQEVPFAPFDTRMRVIDRKSTRLNSSHPSISYAVFCLKKKKQNKTHNLTLSNIIPQS